MHTHMHPKISMCSHDIQQGSQTDHWQTDGRTDGRMVYRANAKYNKLEK